jgi:hypothetical protein
LSRVNDVSRRQPSVINGCSERTLRWVDGEDSLRIDDNSASVVGRRTGGGSRLRRRLARSVSGTRGFRRGAAGGGGCHADADHADHAATLQRTSASRRRAGGERAGRVGATRWIRQLGGMGDEHVIATAVRSDGVTVALTHVGSNFQLEPFG